MKTSIFSSVCVLAVLGVGFGSTCEAGQPGRLVHLQAHRAQVVASATSPTYAGRLGSGGRSWAAIGDIKGEHPLAQPGRSFPTDGLPGDKFGRTRIGDIKGEHPTKLDGVDGERSVYVGRVRHLRAALLGVQPRPWATIGDIKGE